MLMWPRCSVASRAGVLCMTPFRSGLSVACLRIEQAAVGLAALCLALFDYMPLARPLGLEVQVAWRLFGPPQIVGCF